MKHIQQIHKSVALAALASTGALALAVDVSLLKVCYEPTSERYREFNAAFARYSVAQTDAGPTIDALQVGSGGVIDSWQGVSEQFNTEK
jgi:ABC-type sulfate transport system substrate-binding protein